MTRRSFLFLAGVGTAGLALGPFSGTDRLVQQAAATDVLDTSYPWDVMDAERQWQRANADMAALIKKMQTPVWTLPRGHAPAMPPGTVVQSPSWP